MGKKYVRVGKKNHAGINLENLRKWGQLEESDFNERVIIQWIRWH